MARARTIKPGFFLNEDLSDLTPYARLFFIGLWTQADRNGVVEYRPRRLKAELFPHEAVEIGALAVELHGKKFLEMWDYGGTKYIIIPTFSKHQRPHPDERAGDFPQLSEMTRVYPNTVGKNGEPWENTASCASYPSPYSPSPSYPSPSSLGADSAAAPHPAAEKSQDGAEGQRTKKAKPKSENGSAHQALIKHFCDTWNDRYGQPYPFAAAPGKNASSIKAILAGVGGDLKAAKRAVDHFFNDTDQLLVKLQHPLAMLTNQLQRHIGQPMFTSDMENRVFTQEDYEQICRDNPIPPELEKMYQEREADIKAQKERYNARKAREAAEKAEKAKAEAAK